jgi:hypothetical protein
MWIHVTSEDIAQGQRKKAYLCPVALALNRATGMKWVVCMNAAQVSGRDSTLTKLPREATLFINAFDLDEGVSPFKFFLEIAGGTH